MKKKNKSKNLKTKTKAKDLMILLLMVKTTVSMMNSLTLRNLKVVKIQKKKS